MQRRVFIKNKSSQAAEDARGKHYRIRARLGKKQINLAHMAGREKMGGVHRANSISPRKMRGTLADIFKDARKVRSCETYLISQTQSHPKKQSEHPSPRAKATKHLKHFNSNSHLPHNRSFSSHGLRNSLVASGKKDIYKTIEITIDGDRIEPKNKRQLLTSLSKIILGEDVDPENYTFEILEESSILGHEQNFIDIDDIFLQENTWLGKQDFIRI